MKKIIKVLLIILLAIILLLESGVLVLKVVRPKIYLRGQNTINLKLGEEYKEKGAYAKFIFFKLKDKIKISGKVDNTKLGKYKITYEVKNKYVKHKGVKNRIVNVVDKEKPVINLIGSNEIKLYKGSTYEELGYSATDNVDNDITKNVKVTNNIDVNSIGDYEVIYEVYDSSKNKQVEKRKVSVINKDDVKVSGLPVLMYHFFYDKKNGEHGSDNNWLDIAKFEEQVKYLKDNNYYFPDWEEVVQYIDGKIALPEKSVVITSDDGNESFFRLAVPVVDKYDIKATSFVVGSWTYKQYLSNFSSRIKFESHTYDMHKAGCSGMGHGGYFNCVSYEEGLNDLKKSIELTGNSNAIAYPFGDVNSHIKTITKDAGIKLGFTTDYGKVYPGMDKLELPRVRISDAMSLNSFINSL